MARTSVVLVAVAVMLVVAVSAMDPRHYPWRNCNCQCGGERGGHCHCAWQHKMNDVHCRNGGNHWICFPFERQKCWFPCC